MVNMVEKTLVQQAALNKIFCHATAPNITSDVLPGWSASLAVRQGRESIEKLVEDKQYDYKQPVVHDLAVPYQVNPGKKERTKGKKERKNVFATCSRHP